MPQITVRQKLQQLYPTVESLIKARRGYKSWKHMAKSLGMYQQALDDYRKEFGIAYVKEGRQKDILLITPKEIDEGIKRLVGDNATNVVTTYKIVEPERFYKDISGNDGLEPVGVERGTAFNRVWKVWSIE
ncbi:MAG: hypothetical protein WC476_13380 [Phycisphaerae bacterium]|jgi:hypothetical protein